MIADPVLEALVAFGLVGALVRWLARSRRVTPPRWFMAPVDPPAAFRVVPAPPYDWARDGDGRL